MLTLLSSDFSFFFFNDTATTEIYTLSLHDALPIFQLRRASEPRPNLRRQISKVRFQLVRISLHLLKADLTDRKSTRLNSSHQIISYAVFCLKKKKREESTLADYTIT